MDDKTRSLIIMAGTVIFLCGMAMDWHALHRYRSDRAPERIPSWDPKHWRVREYWFTEPRGHQLHQRARWLMSIGSAIAAIFFAIGGFF